MGLRLKFNLVMLLVFSLGVAGAGFVSYDMLQKNARAEVVHTAGLIMESAVSIRNYTIGEIRPLLSLQLKRDFLPQTVPAYAAMRNVSGLRERYPAYTYKEATLNPTNPTSRATEWEASVVEHFRNNRNEDELIGERDTPTGPALYLARPIQVKQEGCLACHGRIDDAPETMLALYGKANGFGWKLDEIVGSQIVSVPMSVPLARADEAFSTFMLSLGSVFLATMVILNLLLHYIVIKPIKQMSGIAQEVSMGQLDAEEFVHNGKDEIASLADSFNRMRRSLVNAFKMLDD